MTQSTQYLRSLVQNSFSEYAFWNQKSQILGTWTLWVILCNMFRRHVCSLRRSALVSRGVRWDAEVGHAL